MISKIEKTQIQNELLPFWLFYNVEHDVIDIAYDKLANDFIDANSYKRYIKQLIRVNETLFFKHIVLLDRGAFIIEINDQFNNYNIRCFDMTDWLKTTYKLIVNGLPSSKINKQSKSEFLEWYKIKINGLEPIKVNSSNNETEVLDLSDTKATEKIIYLQKLGVIDFLRNKNHVSINGLATILSAITGEKKGTLQPMLNPMISKDAGQKNNPLNSKSKVSRINSVLKRY